MARSRDAKEAGHSRPLRVQYILYVLAWAAASGLIVRAVMESDETASAVTTAWFFVAGTGVLVVALVYRDVVLRRRIHGFVDERQALIESIGVVTDPRLNQLPLYRLLDELLARARTALRADTACVFLLEEDHDRLRRSATTGLGAEGNRIVVVPRGEGVIGGVAASRQIVALTDAPKDPAIARGTASLLAAPLVAEGQLLGVLEIGTTQRREFRDNDLGLLQLVADRTAVAIDGTRLEAEARRSRLAAEAALRRLALLADAGGVLARPFENVTAMVKALGDALVPEFADWASFYDLDDDRPRLLTATAGPDVTRRSFETAWTPSVAAALAEGEPQLRWGERLVREWPEARIREITSLVVVPMVVAGSVFGAMLVGTAGRRRGLRPSDLSTSIDLAARLAVAIERVHLSAETERSAERAALHATQLQRLTEAAFAVNAALSAEALAAVVAEQAAHVFEADAAWVELAEKRTAPLRAGETEARRRVAVRVGAYGTAVPGAITTSAPLSDALGATVGAVVVSRAGTPFSPEEENVLGSLAQIASVALVNARLYGTVQGSETRLRALYDASPVGIVELDTQGTAARWNRAAEELFGWPPFDDSVIGTQTVPEAARDFVARALTAESPTSVDVTMGDVEAELVAVPLRDPDGGARGTVLAAVDLTERKHVAEQLQHAQRMEAMARLAGGIAHDFNNVLMVITGYADVLLRRSVDDDSRTDVEAIRAAAKRAAEFTRKLLTISRRQMVQAQVVDVAAEVASLEGVLPVMLGDAIDLALMVEDPPVVFIDPAQFEQLILNLAINAKDAMPDGGTLTIRAQGVEDDGRWALLTVADSGEGMDAETLEHCFEPFFTRKDRTKGTGLGLSTVYGAVTQAGGEIAVESAVGVGTTFTIRLPAATADHAAGSRTGQALELLRVLVVDDDPDVRAIVADMLEVAGHEVVPAASGKIALAVLDEVAPDVLLTDVVMPGMRGTELAKLVVDRMPSVRVVLMSSHVDDELAVDASAMEGALFLAKPFSSDALADVLAACSQLRAQGSNR